jgi:hypothetical protein
MLGLPNDVRLPLEVIKRHMKSANVDEYVLVQLCGRGNGSDYHVEQIQVGSVNVSSILQWLHTETFGLCFLKFLTNEFKEVEVLEHVSDFFKVRIPKGDITIGYAFGSIENAKEQFRVSEYSVSQTTLEQIF